MPWIMKTLFETIVKMSLENNTGLNHMKFTFFAGQNQLYIGSLI